MKKMRIIFPLIALMVIVTMSVFSHAAEVKLDVQANVIAATLTLTNGEMLNFGEIIPGSEDSEITIDASGGTAVQPSVTTGNAGVSGGTSGLVTIQTNISENDATITYSMADSNGVAEQLDDGDGHTMAITNSSIREKSTSSPITTLTVDGPNEIHIGGVLQVDANQTPGNYSGVCTINVNY